MTQGQITIESLQQSHPERLERRHERNFTRQRAKVVVAEVQALQVLHAEQLGRHLRQTHVSKLKELSGVQIFDARGSIQRRA